MLEPYAIGTVVRYHGSLTHMHRVYRITGHSSPKLYRPDLAQYTDEQVAEWYPDNTAYMMWPVGVAEDDPRNRGKYLTSVRRQSITPEPEQP